MGGMSMNHKILFVDLDATLLSDDKTVSEENRAAIQKMLLAGHDIVLSTGRPVESGRAVARELELTRPGCYMIAFNGAVLYDCAADRVLLKRSLPIEVTQELLREPLRREFMRRPTITPRLLPQDIRQSLSITGKNPDFPTSFR